MLSASTWCVEHHVEGVNTSTRGGHAGGLHGGGHALHVVNIAAPSCGSARPLLDGSTRRLER